ncbi:MAG TPA: sodium/proton-translocating pyrophosphatase, partial [Coriobacteriia bacterium]
MGQEPLMLALILGFSIVGLGASLLLGRWVLKQDTGTAAMREVSDAIKVGAEAFMKRQYRTII